MIEFGKVIGPLTDPAAHGGDPADAFHVVCPSLPGYGVSGKPSAPGWGIGRIAAASATLMARLGYSRYGAQGGDWGTSISTLLARHDSQHVAGIHLTPPLAPPDPATFGDLTEAERSTLASLEHSADWDSGYSKEHSTRPQTIGYALTDSPAALCAWIIEKFAVVYQICPRSFADSNGDGIGTIAAGLPALRPAEALQPEPLPGASRGAALARSGYGDPLSVARHEPTCWLGYCGGPGWSLVSALRRSG